MARRRHNPERRIFRGRSYKKHGEHLSVLREQPVDVDHDSDDALCGCCRKNPAAADHGCPYAEELRDIGDDEVVCNCCDDCMHECAMDI